MKCTSVFLSRDTAIQILVHFMHPTSERANKNRPQSHEESAGGFVLKDSGDNRLSRQRHYHGPGGLNGRVRNGNGWDPASMVAGNSSGGR